jgi:hypothetical protein
MTQRAIRSLPNILEINVKAMECKETHFEEVKACFYSPSIIMVWGNGSSFPTASIRA